MDELKKQLKALLEQRARLFESESKPLIDATQGRALTADETAKFESIDREFASFDAKVRHLRSQIDTEEQRAALDLQPTARTANGIADRLRSVLVERTQVGTDLTFTTAEVTRALGTATAADGAGNTIPSTFWSEFVQPLRDFASVIDAGARVIVTSSGETIKVPRLKTFGAAEKGKAANAALAGTDPTFDQVDWSTTKYDQVTLAPRELIEDSAIDIEGLIGGLIGQNVGLLYGGDSSTATATSATTAVTGAGLIPTIDELIDVQHSILRPYRRNAAWVINDLAVAGVRKIKDTTGQYIWQPSVQVDKPDVLLGKPLFTDAFLDAPAAGSKKPVLFGDFSKVWVRLVGSLRLERSDQAAFLNDQIAFKGVLRAGSVLTDQNAVKAFMSKVA